MENTTNKFPQPPKSWLTESILVTLMCCLPFGIVGIISAAKVESRFYAGDLEGANRHAAEAKKWTMIGLWTGVGLIVAYILVYVAFFVIMLATDGFK